MSAIPSAGPVQTANPDNQFLPQHAATSLQTYQMDLGGIIRLLSHNLYAQGPDVIIRELLQNAVDAQTARRQVDPRHQGRIELELQPLDGGGQMLIVSDNGLGIAHEEIVSSLGTIAFSLKRQGPDEDESGQAFIGRFGVGLLSCFMAADEIVVISRKAVPGAAAFRWVGHRHGQWEVHPVSAEVEPGTRVCLQLHPAAAARLQPARIVELAARFGEYLPDLITVRAPGLDETVTRPPCWSRDAGLGEEALLEWARQKLGGEFTGSFRFACPALGAEGVGFIVAGRVNPGAEPLHRLYVRRMFVSDHARGLSPVQAPYVRVVVNAGALRVNAAREDLHGEETRLGELREAVRAGLADYLEGLARDDFARLVRIVRTHSECFLAEAEATGAHLHLLRRAVLLSTTVGECTVDEALKRHGQVQFVTQEGEYLRLELKAAQEGVCVAQGHYQTQGRLLALLARKLGHGLVKETTAAEFLAGFRAQEAVYGPREQSFLRVAAEEMRLDRCAADLSEGDDPYSPATLELEDMDSILRHLDPARQEKDGDQGVCAKRLTFNLGHPVVESLVQTPDLPDDLRRAWARVFYHQALLAARERPTAGEARRHARALALIWKSGLSLNF